MRNSTKLLQILGVLEQLIFKPTLVIIKLLSCHHFVILNFNHRSVSLFAWHVSGAMVRYKICIYHGGLVIHFIIGWLIMVTKGASWTVI